VQLFSLRKLKNKVMPSILGEKIVQRPKYRNSVTFWNVLFPGTLLDLSDPHNTTTGGLTPPEGYILVAMEDEKRRFSIPTNIAYGANGNFLYIPNAVGEIYFSSSAFGGDPAPYVKKGGYAEVTPTNKSEVTAMANQQAISTNVSTENNPGDNEQPTTNTKSNKTLIYTGIGVGVIAIGLILFLVLRKKKS
jgi:LPXTG-motif cell wall-anchored protein